MNSSAEYSTESSPVVGDLRVPWRTDELWSIFRDPEAATISDPYTTLGSLETSCSLWLELYEFLLRSEMDREVPRPALWIVLEVMSVPVTILKLGGTTPGVRGGGRGKIGGGSGNSSGCTLTCVSPLSSTYIE